MRIELNIKKGKKQQLFLDYFNSALRNVSTSASGSSQFYEDGTFESSTTIDFLVDDRAAPLTWKITKLPNGSLEGIEINNVDANDKEEPWREDVSNFINTLLTNAFKEKQQEFFFRRIFYYIGSQLDGEYWLPGFRFAPLNIEDSEPFLLKAERVVSFDMNIEAIDRMNAMSLADVRASRHAARLSLLLNIGLYQPQGTSRWVITANEESERYQLGFRARDINIYQMPKKGEICELGKYSGSLAGIYTSAGELNSMPKESRKILRGLENAEQKIADRFDRCARLYQVAAVVGSRFPSVGLAYRVAAVEAIVQGNSEFDGFSDFIRKNISGRAKLNEDLDFLYSDVRSAHFHAGKFPMGEYDQMRFFDQLRGSDDIQRMEKRSVGYELTREAIINWLSRVIPEVEGAETND